MLMDGHSSTENNGTGEGSTKRDCSRVTIDILPDLALLNIFGFYVHEDRVSIDSVEVWYTLVHVCRKWRNVVFASPRRLDIRLLCTSSTSTREIMDVWPRLPIVVRADGYKNWRTDNIVAALELNDRITELGYLDFSNSQWENVLAALQQPFPALSCLCLRIRDDAIPSVLPDSFLGGSAAGLKTIKLYRIPFPALPKLLLSATHLVYLNLWEIPHHGYISPEAMLACLSALTRLETLEIGLESSRSHPDRESRRPPLTRSLFPVLARLQFKGASEYLEGLVDGIDAPLLDKMDITLFRQLIFDTPQLTQFISRTPRFKAQERARVVLIPTGKFGSHFHRRLAESSVWESQADNQIGNFRHWHRSVGLPFPRLSSSRWNTCTCLGDVCCECFSRTPLRAADGWRFSVRLPL